MAQTRLELISIELSEAKEHLLITVVLILASMVTIGIGLVLATLAIILAYWDSHPLIALGVLALLYLVAGGLLAVGGLREARRAPKLFSSSLAELSRDSQRLGPAP